MQSFWDVYEQSKFGTINQYLKPFMVQAYKIIQQEHLICWVFGWLERALLG
jgi:hypothetical protein